MIVFIPLDGHPIAFEHFPIGEPAIPKINLIILPKIILPSEPHRKRIKLIPLKGRKALPILRLFLLCIVIMNGVLESSTSKPLVELYNQLAVIVRVFFHILNRFYGDLGLHATCFVLFYGHQPMLEQLSYVQSRPISPIDRLHKLPIQILKSLFKNLGSLLIQILCLPNLPVVAPELHGGILLLNILIIVIAPIRLITRAQVIVIWHLAILFVVSRL